jgi:hypothetical protein
MYAAAGAPRQDAAIPYRRRLHKGRHPPRRYLEVQSALKDDPGNRALKREMKELKRYRDFFLSDGERSLRHKAQRMLRRGVEEDVTHDDVDSADENS